MEGEAAAGYASHRQIVTHTEVQRITALLRVFPVFPAFQFFDAALGKEKQQSQYSYGFPDGDGDCNCVTWIERLGLPLLTGRMDEFLALPGRPSHPSRRFGRCL